MASRLVALGLVYKLVTLVRQSTQGPPPPLPPREGDSAVAASSTESAREVPAGTARDSGAESPPDRREEVCAALSALAGLAEHAECVPLILDSGELGCLLQVRKSERARDRVTVRGVQNHCEMTRQGARVRHATGGNVCRCHCTIDTVLTLCDGLVMCQKIVAVGLLSRLQ